MDIVTAFSRTELEQIITASVQRCLYGTVPTPAPEINDTCGIDDACEITGFAKPTVYKLSFKGEIPCKKFGKRLVFSRRELAEWMQDRTVCKQSPIEAATMHLQEVAEKRY